MPVPKNISTATAPKDEAWNAPALKDFTSESWDNLTDAQKRGIMQHFAWAPSLTPADVTYTALKLPHHDPKTGHVNWKGLVAAVAVMQGARGGADIPQADVDAVKAHLAKHYKAFDATPPWEKAGPREIERKTITLADAKMDTNGNGTFEGYASTFGNKDLQDDIIQPGAFKKTISDNQGLFLLLDQHDHKTEIGLVHAQEDQRGLYVKGQFYIDPNGDQTNEIKAAREAYVKMRRRQEAGKPLQMSIGYRAINPTYKNGVRLLGEVALAEVSLVTFPANPLAETTSVKDFNQELQEDEMQDAAWDRIGPLMSALHDVIWDAIEPNDEDDNDPQTIDQLRVDLAQFSQSILAAVTALRGMSPAQLQEARQSLDIQSKGLRAASDAFKQLIASTNPEPGNHSEKAAGESEPPHITALTGFIHDLSPQPANHLAEAVDAFKRDARTLLET